MEMEENINNPVNDEADVLRRRLEELKLPEGSIIRINDVIPLGNLGYFRIKGRKIEDTPMDAVDFGINFYLGFDFDIITNFKIVVRMNLQNIHEVVRYDGIDYLIGDKDIWDDGKNGISKKYFLKILSNIGEKNGVNGDNIIGYADDLKYLGNGIFQYQELGQTKTVDVSKSHTSHNGDSCRDEHDLSVISKVNKTDYTIIENPLNKKNGLVDEFRNTIFECEYDLIWRLHDSEGKYYLLAKNGLYFIFNAQSCELSEFKFEVDGWKIFQNGLLRCIDEEHNQYVYFDEDLNPVLKTSESFTCIFYKNGYLCKRKLGFDGFLYSIVNCKTGEILLPDLDGIKVKMIGDRLLRISDWGAYEGLSQFDKYIFFDFVTGEFRDVFFTISSGQDGCITLDFAEFKQYDEQNSGSQQYGDGKSDDVQSVDDRGYQKFLSLFG